MTAESDDRFSLRRSERFTVRSASAIAAQLEYELDGIATSLPAELVDISMNGMKLKVASAIPIRQALVVAVQAESCGVGGRYLADVCWSRPCDAQNWWIGVSLRKELDHETLDRMAVTQIIDRRRDRRLPQNVHVMARRELESKPFPARLVDLSQGGFSIHASEAGAEGDRISLILDPQDPTSAPVLARVCWRRADGTNSYVMGCKFLSSHGASELRRALARCALQMEPPPHFGWARRTTAWTAAATFAIATVLGVALQRGQRPLPSASDTWAPVAIVSQVDLDVAPPAIEWDRDSSAFPEDRLAASTPPVRPAGATLESPDAKPAHPLSQHIDRLFDRWEQARTSP